MSVQLECEQQYKKQLQAEVRGVWHYFSSLYECIMCNGECFMYLLMSDGVRRKKGIQCPFFNWVSSWLTSERES